MKEMVKARFTPWYESESDAVDVWVSAKIKSNAYSSGYGVVILFGDGLGSTVDSSLYLTTISGEYSKLPIYDFTALDKE